MSSRGLVYFHIGAPKTGTTFLQQTFWQNRDVFERYGLVYPFTLWFDPNAPRFANAELFKLNDAREARALVRAVEGKTILVSEEGMFANPGEFIPAHEAFDGWTKKAILYVRPTADFICSWCSEYTRPYNAHNGQLLGFQDALDVVCKNYEQGFLGLQKIIDIVGGDANVILRSYESSVFKGRGLLPDFLSIFDLNYCQISPELVVPNGRPNEGVSRKYVDISHLIWAKLRSAGQAYLYCQEFVDAVYGACISGDDRKVIETICDNEIEALIYKFAFLEEELSARFLAGRPLFRNRFPSSYQLPRPPYTPVSVIEVELLMLLYVVSRRMDEIEQTSPTTDLSVDAIIRRLGAVISAHGDHSEELQRQREEIERMTVLARQAGSPHRSS